MNTKGDEGMLLSNEEILNAIRDGYEVVDGVEMRTICAKSIAKAQLAKDQEYESTILEPQCQARVEKEVGEWIEKHRVCDPVTGELKGYWLSPEEIEALKKGVLPK